jgi:hypothetical protein
MRDVQVQGAAAGDEAVHLKQSGGCDCGNAGTSESYDTTILGTILRNGSGTGIRRRRTATQLDDTAPR